MGGMKNIHLILLIFGLEWAQMAGKAVQMYTLAQQIQTETLAPGRRMGAYLSQRRTF